MTDVLIHIPKRPPRSRPRGRFSRPVRAAYRLLGIKPGATLEQIKTAFRGLAHKIHPDHQNTNIPDELIAAKEAYDLICEDYEKKHRKPGPQATKLKYSGYAIIDTANNEVVADGYSSRKLAEADIPALIEKDKLLPKYDPKSKTSEDGLRPQRDLKTKKLPQYAAVGSPEAERKKKQRARQAAERKRLEEPKKPKRSEKEDPDAWQDYYDAVKQFRYEWNHHLSCGLTEADGSKLNLSMNRGRYIDDAPTGKGLLMTGGWDTRLLDVADAAHQTSEGEYGYVARKIRGKRAPSGPDCFDEPWDEELREGDCWRSLRGPGNGPDAFEAEDQTADSADCEPYSELSAGDLQTEAFFGGKTDDARLLPCTEGWDDPASDFESRLSATELGALDESNIPVEMVPEKLDRYVPAGEFSEFPEKEIQEASQSPFYLDDPATAEERREEESTALPETPVKALPAQPVLALEEKPKCHAIKYQYSDKLLTP